MQQVENQLVEEDLEEFSPEEWARQREDEATIKEEKIEVSVKSCCNKDCMKKGLNEYCDGIKCICDFIGGFLFIFNCLG